MTHIRCTFGIKKLPLCLTLVYIRPSATLLLNSITCTRDNLIAGMHLTNNHLIFMCVWGGGGEEDFPGLKTSSCHLIFMGGLLGGGGLRR